MGHNPDPEQFYGFLTGKWHLTRNETWVVSSWPSCCEILSLSNLTKIVFDLILSPWDSQRLIPRKCWQKVVGWNVFAKDILYRPKMWPFFPVSGWGWDTGKIVRNTWKHRSVRSAGKKACFVLGVTGFCIIQNFSKALYVLEIHKKFEVRNSLELPVLK